MAWWLPILEVAGAALSSAISNNGADDAADAARAGNTEATKLARDVYTDQRALSMPNYLTGGAATNKLGSMYNIAPQDYTRASMGEPGGVTGSGFDWSAYLAQNPDVAGDWNKNAKLRGLYPNINDFAAYHYQNFGQREGRALPTSGGGTYSPQPAGGAQPVNALSSGYDMQEFWDSPQGKLATEQFIGSDNPAIKAAFATGGKVLSGAQQNALADRGRSTAGGFFQDYTRGLQSLAGLNQTAGSEISNAGGTYAANAGNIAMNTGQINANKSLMLNNNWKTFGKNALGAYI